MRQLLGLLLQAALDIPEVMDGIVNIAARPLRLTALPAPGVPARHRLARPAGRHLANRVRHVEATRAILGGAPTRRTAHAPGHPRRRARQQPKLRTLLLRAVLPRSGSCPPCGRRTRQRTNSTSSSLPAASTVKRRCATSRDRGSQSHRFVIWNRPGKPALSAWIAVVLPMPLIHTYRLPDQTRQCGSSGTPGIGGQPGVATPRPQTWTTESGDRSGSGGSVSPKISCKRPWTTGWSRSWVKRSQCCSDSQTSR